MAESPVRRSFTSNLRKSFNYVQGEVGNIESKWAMFPPSASTPTTTQSFSSRSGSSAPSASSGTADQSVPPQHEGTTSTDVLLIVGLTVAVTVILLSVALLVFCRRRSCKPLTGLRTRRKSDSSNMENVTYENCTPPTCEDSTYQSLDTASRDQNQVYSTLTEHL
ncbi:uncharacterized protein PAE49_010929 [Odontesthes bonariensis]